jgi:SAM-dependent methyltransferase
MKVTKEKYDQLVNTMSIFSNNVSYELEAKCTKRLIKNDFVKIIQFYRSKFAETIHEETLDISIKNNATSSYRISLIGNEPISSFCQLNTIDESLYNDIPIMIKKNVENVKPLYIDGLDFKIDLKDEDKNITLEKRNDIFKNLRSEEKSFRYKKRFSYTAKNSMFRYDCTIVKSAYNRYTLADSNIEKTPESYEVEIEVLRENRDSPKNYSQEFLRAIMELQLILEGESDSERLVSKDAKKKIMQEYFNLCFPNERIFQTSRKYFLGPQPVTLEMKNLEPPDFGKTSILVDYTVTDKADGERSLMFVDGEGKAFLINNRFNIKYTGVALKTFKNMLLDGEYITKDVNGKDINMYAIFDIYYGNEGKTLSNLPLLDDKNGESRHSFMKDYVTKVAPEFKKKSMEVVLKEFLSGEDILKQSANLYKKRLNTGIYHVDGLIFTPKKLAVGALFENDVPSIKKTWPNAFKWKPPSENTIDFLVKFDRDPNGTPFKAFKNGTEYISTKLFVGYNPVQWEPISAIKYFSTTFTRQDEYIIKNFVPPDRTDDKVSQYIGELKCKDGSIIDDFTVVEFSYDTDQDSWVPLRVRMDKTEAYLKNGLGNSLNDFGTAVNIWRSIQEPVTLDYFEGKKKVVESKDADIYYDRTLPNEKMASKNMKYFHSKIKYNIIAADQPQTLFDIACGKAGDLPKWLDARIKKVVGVDVFRDNIENQVDGAYARTFKKAVEMKRINKNDYVYMTMDSSQVFGKDYFETFKNENDKIMANVLWGLVPKDSIRKDMGFLKEMHGIVSKKFNMVSCQFAIHYFFASEKSLDNFITNIDNLLADGGCFIGTCLDGFQVKKFLKDLNVNESKLGELDGRVMWNIKKLYKNKTLSSIEFGEEIEIYMESIGRRLKEYLVNIKVLEQKLKKRNIILEEVRDFKTDYANIGENNGGIVMNDVEKMYSFLNISFKFRKVGNKSSPRSSPRSSPQPDVGLLEYDGKNSCFVDSALMALFHHRPNNIFEKMFLNETNIANPSPKSVKKYAKMDEEVDLIRKELSNIYLANNTNNDTKKQCTDIRRLFKTYDEKYNKIFGVESDIEWINTQHEPFDVYQMLNKIFRIAPSIEYRIGKPGAASPRKQMHDWNSPMVILDELHLKKEDSIFIKDYVPTFIKSWKDSNTNVDHKQKQQIVNLESPVLFINVIRSSQTKDDHQNIKLMNQVFPEESVSIAGTILNCVSILVHRGNNVTGGHYTCIIKSHTNGKWYHFDDTKDSLEKIGTFEDVLNDFVTCNLTGCLYL